MTSEETKYTGKQESGYNPVVNSEEDLRIKQLIMSANCFGVSPEAKKSMFEANEKAKQMAQK